MNNPLTKHTPGPWDWRDIDDLRQAKSTRTDGRYGESVLYASYDYERGGPYHGRPATFVGRRNGRDTMKTATVRKHLAKRGYSRTVRRETRQALALEVTHAEF